LETLSLLLLRCCVRKKGVLFLLSVGIISIHFRTLIGDTENFSEFCLNIRDVHRPLPYPTLHDRARLRHEVPRVGLGFKNLTLTAYSVMKKLIRHISTQYDMETYSSHSWNCFSKCCRELSWYYLTYDRNRVVGFAGCLELCVE
jgi:hypothetical protein